MENKRSKSFSDNFANSVNKDILIFLRNEIQKGIDSRRVENFDAIEYLKRIKIQRKEKL